MKALLLLLQLLPALAFAFPTDYLTEEHSARYQLVIVYQEVDVSYTQRDFLGIFATEDECRIEGFRQEYIYTSRMKYHAVEFYCDPL